MPMYMWFSSSVVVGEFQIYATRMMMITMRSRAPSPMYMDSPSLDGRNVARPYPVSGRAKHLELTLVIQR